MRGRSGRAIAIGESRPGTERLRSRPLGPRRQDLHIVGRRSAGNDDRDRPQALGGEIVAPRGKGQVPRLLEQGDRLIDLAQLEERFGQVIAAIDAVGVDLQQAVERLGRQRRSFEPVEKHEANLAMRGAEIGVQSRGRFEAADGFSNAIEPQRGEAQIVLRLRGIRSLFRCPTQIVVGPRISLAGRDQPAQSERFAGIGSRADERVEQAGRRRQVAAFQEFPSAGDVHIGDLHAGNGVGRNRVFAPR